MDDVSLTRLAQVVTIPATLDKPTLDYNNTGTIDCIFAVEYLFGAQDRVDRYAES
jgi:hypothetical protein